MFGMVYASLFTGSLRGRSDAILVFVNMIATADRDGIVDKHPRAIADETGLTLEQTHAAIAELMAPDPDSRSPGNDGKRLVLLDEHRTWGWRIVNHGKYRAMRSEEEKREQSRARSARYRDSRRGKEEVEEDVTRVTQNHAASRARHAASRARHASSRARHAESRCVTLPSALACAGAPAHRSLFSSSNNNLLEDIDNTYQVTMSNTDSVTDVTGTPSGLQVNTGVDSDAEGGTCNVPPSAEQAPSTEQVPEKTHKRKRTTTPTTSDSKTSPNAPKSTTIDDQGKRHDDLPGGGANATGGEPAALNAKGYKVSLIAIPERLDTPEFRVAWAEWIAYRSKMHGQWLPESAEKKLDSLAKIGPERAVAAIRHSIESSWKGIFESGESRRRHHGDDPRGNKKAVHDAVQKYEKKYAEFSSGMNADTFSGGSLLPFFDISKGD